jgi:hypothetical protein
MSKSELKYKLKSEISTINRVIDQKILRGLPYDREARYHKNLLKRLDSGPSLQPLGPLDAHLRNDHVLINITIVKPP